MLPFFFASPIAMELLKIHFRRHMATVQETARPLAAPGEFATVSPLAAAPAPQRITGGNTMLKVLIPVDGSGNCKFAVQHVIKQFMNNTAMEIHLLNVQQPFSADIAHFTSRKSREDYHREQGEKALEPVKRMLDGFSIPYAVHIEVGDKARLITDAARRLRCDRIVMATARKNTLTRLVENSVTNEVLELASVPVEVIAGDSMSRWERYGIPAAIAAAVAVALAVED
jgi:nucleotide-binding universal stress UspA family protein